MFINIRRELLERPNVTHGDLAAAIGISKKSLSNKMNGRTGFTLKEMRCIQAFFSGKPLDYLFYTPPPTREAI